MELITELPNEIHFNVIKFMKHPLAEIVDDFHFRPRRENILFNILKRNRLDGSAFDRGRADAYYDRKWDPHKWIYTSLYERPTRDIRLREEEFEEYEIGYSWEHDRKNPTYIN